MRFLLCWKDKALILFIIFFGLMTQPPALAANNNKLEMMFQELHIQKIYRPFRPADFSLLDLQGQRHQLSDFRGKVILLNFWATWCGPCRFELPSLSKLHEETKGQNVAIVAVAVDSGGEKAVAPVVKEQRLPFMVLLDPENRETPSFDTGAIPVTYLLSKDGLVIGIIKEAIHWDAPKVFQLITLLLAQEEETVLPKIASLTVETQSTLDKDKIFLDVEVTVRNPQPGLQFKPPVLKDMRGIRQTKMEQVSEVTRHRLDLIQKTNFRFTLAWEADRREASIGNILIAYKMNEQTFWETKNAPGLQFKGASTQNGKLKMSVGGAFVLAALAAWFLWRKRKKKQT